MGKRRLYQAARLARAARASAAVTWREQLAALQYVPRLVRLVFQTHRGYTVAILLLRILRSFIPVPVRWVGKLSIDGVIAPAATARAGGVPDSRHLAGPVALALGIAVVRQALARLSASLEIRLG